MTRAQFEARRRERHIHFKAFAGLVLLPAFLGAPFEYIFRHEAVLFWGALATAAVAAIAFLIYEARDAIQRKVLDP